MAITELLKTSSGVDGLNENDDASEVDVVTVTPPAVEETFGCRVEIT